MESPLQLALLLFLPAVGTALFLPAVGTALFLPVVGTALFFMGPRVPSPAVFLSFTSVRSVFFCSHLPSPVAIGLLFRAPRTRCILLLLHLSWLTDSLSPFLSSEAVTFWLLFRASGTRGRLLLLLGRFLVSARARLRARWLLLT